VVTVAACLHAGFDVTGVWIDHCTGVWVSLIG